jgi:hypothetical protein
MVTKRILRPERLRVVPRSFSWVDHGLLRDGHLERLQPREILLYFFLVLVGDRRGLSYYSPPAISRYLKLSEDEIRHARRSLAERGLIAFQKPLYQVLSLPQGEKANPSLRARGAREGSGPSSIGSLLEQLFQKDRNPRH